MPMECDGRVTMRRRARRPPDALDPRGGARPVAPAPAAGGGRPVSYRGKRALDVAVAAGALAATAPVLAVAAVLVRLETHGHALYRQRRVGLDGEPFELYKLRT